MRKKCQKVRAFVLKDAIFLLKIAAKEGTAPGTVKQSPHIVNRTVETNHKQPNTVTAWRLLSQSVR